MGQVFDTSTVHKKGIKDGCMGGSNKRAIEEGDYEQCLKMLKGSGFEFHLKPQEQKMIEDGKVPQLCKEKLNVAHRVSRGMCKVLADMLSGCYIVWLVSELVCFKLASPQSITSLPNFDVHIISS